MNKRRLSQASLLRLPFSRAGKKHGSDFEFAFSRAGKKQNGSDFQFAFSRAGKKQNGSDFEFAFSQPGKKQNGSDFQFAFWKQAAPARLELPFAFFQPGTKWLQEKAKWLLILLFPGPGKRKSLAPYPDFLLLRPHRPQLSEKLLFLRLSKSKLDVQFAFPAQTSNLLFPGPGKSIGSLSHFAFSQPGKRQLEVWAILLFAGPGKSKLDV